MVRKLIALIAAATCVCLGFAFFYVGPKLGSATLSSTQTSGLLSETPDTRDIISHLKVYQAFAMKGPLEFRRLGRAYDGGYVVPELALQEADVVLGYGISDDISFEEMAAEIYGKPSYGFDGTCPTIDVKQPLCQFIPLSIVSHAKTQHSPNEIHGSSSFDQQIDFLEIGDKKLFVKMDIEGNEYGVLPDILQHASQITGLALEIHFCENTQIPQALNLLKMLEKDFLLVHVHGNNCCLDFFETSNALGHITRVLELSYINRQLICEYQASPDQTHPTPLDMANAPHLPEVTFTIL